MANASPHVEILRRGDEKRAEFFISVPLFSPASVLEFNAKRLEIYCVSAAIPRSACEVATGMRVTPLLA
jgi:hypothetical protein